MKKIFIQKIKQNQKGAKKIVKRINRNKGKKTDIREHASKEPTREAGLPEDVRVVHAEEHNPDDG